MRYPRPGKRVCEIDFLVADVKIAQKLQRFDDNRSAALVVFYVWMTLENQSYACGRYGSEAQ